MSMNTSKEIKVHDTVWVDMSNWPAPLLPHESGYAVVIDVHMLVLLESEQLVYDVQFRGSDEVIMVNERRVTPVYEKEDAQEDTMHDGHYRDAIVEPILVMQDFFSHDELIGFLKGNILKYRLRAGHKGTKEEMQADLDKIRVYEKWLDAIKNGERIEL